MLKKQILNIDYKEDQGIILEWNYSDLSIQSKFYRHILFLCSNQMEKAQQFVENYVKRIKPGDLYLTLYANQKQVVRCRSWRQKLVNDELKINHYLSEQIVANLKQEMMQKVKNQYTCFPEPIVFNVLLSNKSNAHYFQETIHTYRLEHNLQFICSLFGPFPNSEISVNRGLNFLSTTCEPLSIMTSYYHKFINQIAIQHAALSISCHNGTIASHNEEQWQNQGFDRIVRNFYGPSVLYKRDVLSFMNSNLAESGSYELTIHLKFLCFDGISYQSIKDLVINFDQNRIHNLTMACKQGKNRSYVKNGIELSSSPYSTATTILFSKIQGKSQEIK